VGRAWRTTGPLLDVSSRLLRADAQGEDLHGWQIMKDTKRTGPTVYGVLDRLEDLGWITSYWEAQQPDENRPRRRLYRLTDQGRSQAYELLKKSRPEELERLSQENQRSPGLLLPRRPALPDGA
jgi:PadR family transcriptional regulator, regulatory protein PadR